MGEVLQRRSSAVNKVMQFYEAALSEVCQLEDKNELLEQQNSKLLQQNSQLQQQFIKLQTEVSQSESKYSQMLSDNFKVQQEKSKLQEQCIALQGKVTHLSTQNHKLQIEKSQMLEKLKQLSQLHNGSPETPTENSSLFGQEQEKSTLQESISQLLKTSFQVAEETKLETQHESTTIPSPNILLNQESHFTTEDLEPSTTSRGASPELTDQPAESCPADGDEKPEQAHENGYHENSEEDKPTENHTSPSTTIKQLDTALDKPVTATNTQQSGSNEQLVQHILTLCGASSQNTANPLSAFLKPTSGGSAETVKDDSTWDGVFDKPNNDLPVAEENAQNSEDTHSAKTPKPSSSVAPIKHKTPLLETPEYFKNFGDNKQRRWASRENLHREQGTESRNRHGREFSRSDRYKNDTDKSSFHGKSNGSPRDKNEDSKSRHASDHRPRDKRRAEEDLARRPRKQRIISEDNHKNHYEKTCFVADKSKFKLPPSRKKTEIDDESSLMLYMQLGKRRH